MSAPSKPNHRVPGPVKATREEAMALILDRYIPEPNSGCWLFPDGIGPTGYGKVMLPSSKKYVAAHRLSYHAFKGDPGRLHVCHKCDTRACVNPDHLFPGTHLVNMRDAYAKGRFKNRKKLTYFPGTRSYTSKLNPEKQREILAARKVGASYALAQKYQVSIGTIKRIWQGFTYKYPEKTKP